MESAVVVRKNRSLRQAALQRKTAYVGLGVLALAGCVLLARGESSAAPSISRSTAASPPQPPPPPGVTLQSGSAAKANNARSGPAATKSERAARSPWGKDDELGTLNLMTDETRLRALSRIGSGKVYDLSVEYYVGMPSWYAVGDPRYQYHLTHTPHGSIVDDP